MGRAYLLSVQAWPVTGQLFLSVTVALLSVKFLIFHGPQMFITMFIRDRHVSLSSLRFTTRPTIDAVYAEILTASVKEKRRPNVFHGAHILDAYRMSRK